MEAVRLLLRFALCLSALEFRHSVVVVDINTSEVWTSVSQSFQSLAIDANVIANDFKMVDFKSPKLLALCKGLRGNAQRAEVFLRIGGGKEDNIVYKPNGQDKYTLPVYTLNNTEWDILNEFAFDLRWKLVFGLNVLTFRKRDGSWDPSNSIELIRYTESKGYVVQYELGNEPVHFAKIGNITVPPDQLARDFTLLKVILQSEARGEPMLIGPDTSANPRGRKYLEGFLAAMEPDILDAISYHFYYSRSENITAHNFTDPEYLDLFLSKSLLVRKLVAGYPHVADTPIWAGETSSTSGGGSKLIGMSYVAGLVYLDKLGLAAQMNISVVIKQTLIGGWYALLDRLTMDPSPTYWVTLLHKQLVGQKVLQLDGFLQYGRKLRTYAHCIDPYGGRGYQSSAIILIAINLDKNVTAALTFGHELSSQIVDQYLLTPGNGTITDTSVKLNGKVLKMSSPTTLPDLKPEKVKQPLLLPPLSYAFYVLPDAEAEACMDNQVREEDDSDM